MKQEKKMNAFKIMLIAFSLSCIALSSPAVFSAEHPAAREVSIAVSGMHCGACAQSVTKAVSSMAGIESCEVSASEGMAKISYDPDEVSLDEIVETINKTGFKASKPS